MKPPAGVIADAADDDRRRRADRGHLAAADQVEREPDDQGAGRAEQRVGEGEHARVAGREAAAAVEAEPAEPQQAGAEQHVDGVVGEQRLAAVVLAGADHQRRRQRREAGAHLDRDAAGEVEGAAFAAASRRRRPSGRARRRRAPTTARRRRGTAPKRIRSTTAPETSADGDDAEGRLEGEEDELRDRRPVARREADAVEERVVEAADRSAASPSKASE